MRVGFKVVSEATKGLVALPIMPTEGQRCPLGWLC